MTLLKIDKILDIDREFSLCRCSAYAGVHIKEVRRDRCIELVEASPPATRTKVFLLNSTNSNSTNLNPPD